jgi:polyhydroxyalkanoate synthesis regulator phasin
MEGPIEKAFLMGLGLLDLTREKAEKIVEELVKKGEVAKEKQPDFVKRLLERSKAGRTEVEKIVENAVSNVVKKLDVPTRSAIDTLSKKIDELGKKLKK